HEARLDGELVGGQAQRLARVLLRHPFHVVEDAAGLHDHDPLVGRALALAHARLLRLLGDGLVREHADPDAPAALDEAGDGDAAGLDLAVGDPAALEGLEAVVPEGDLRARPGLAPHLPALLLPVLDLLRHEHDDVPYRPLFGFSASCSPLKIQHFTPMAPKFVRASWSP